MSGDTFILCYVRLPYAYFTPLSLNEQQGDDWDDAPYEHNADPPYEHDEEYRGIEIKKVIICQCRARAMGKFRPDSEYEWTENDYKTPDYAYSNSPYSVDNINAGEVPWLSSKIMPDIYAGVEIEEFKKIMSENDIDIYEVQE